MRHKLINYSIGEEIFSAITHGIGALLGVSGLVYMLIISITRGDALSIFACAVYGLSIIILYTMSTLYHAISNKKAKTVFRVLDHSTIFLLIAGTYTPIALIALKGIIGYLIFALQWVIAITGIILNSISIEKFKVFSMIGYIFCGWVIIFAAYPMAKATPLPALILLIAGGVAYTGGLFFYKQKLIRYMHSIWHLFVLAGSILQFIAISFYII